MENIDLSEAKIYVGTYAKYNNGSIYGAWLNLNDYLDIDEFYEACKQLHKDEEDPEFMFQDWENIPSGLISECSFDEKFFEIRDKIEELSTNESDAFFEWLNYTGNDFSDIDDLINDFRDKFVGEYDSEEDFAYEIIEECYDLPEFAKTYFDYAAFARDLFSCDYVYYGGYVFRN